MGRFNDFKKDHPEIDFGELCVSALRFKSADKPFHDHWRNQVDAMCLEYFGAIHHSISLQNDCEGDFDLYEDEIEKQRKGFFLSDCLIGTINNTNQKRKVLSDHLKTLFDAFPRRVLNCTLTLREENLPNSPQEEDELERKVVDWCYSHSLYFILNRDYRPESGAIHWHLYIEGDYIDPNEWNELDFGGFSKIKRAKWNSKATARYLTKYETHCLKASTNGHNVIYSRGVKQLVKEKKEKTK